MTYAGCRGSGAATRSAPGSGRRAVRRSRACRAAAPARRVRQGAASSVLVRISRGRASSSMSRDPLGGQVRVDGQVGRARLQHGEDREQVSAERGSDRTTIRSGPAPCSTSRRASRLARSLSSAKVQRDRTRDDRDRVRGGGRLGLENRRDGGGRAGRHGERGVVPGREDGAAVGGAEDVDPAEDRSASDVIASKSRTIEAVIRSAVARSNRSGRYSAVRGRRSAGSTAQANG